MRTLLLSGSDEVGQGHYGPHLVLDAYGCHVTRLQDMRWVYRWLEGLPAIIGMETLFQPSVHWYDGGQAGKPEAGVSGVIGLVTSHASIHTYPWKEVDGGGVAFVDVFSCKPFDPAAVEAYFREAFGGKDIEAILIGRGRRFPR